MDGKELIDYLKAPSRYPRHTFRGDGSLDPVNIGDLNGVLARVSHFVERLRLSEFCLRTENWSGLVVVYAMDNREPRDRLREALETDRFTVTERSDEYGTSLEVHPRQVDLIMTRYDLIVDTIAEVLPEARELADLQAGVAQRLGHPVPTGLLRGTIQVFDISLIERRKGRPFGSKVPPGMVRLVTVALETDVIPPLCGRLPTS
ncbi:hypothetical protein ACWFRQ_03625 [Streptomyces niveus]